MWSEKIEEIHLDGLIAINLINIINMLQWLLNTLTAFSKLHVTGNLRLDTKNRNRILTLKDKTHFVFKQGRVYFSSEKKKFYEVLAKEYHK